MKNDLQPDICQYLVSSKQAFFNYVDANYIKLEDSEVETNILDESEAIVSSHSTIDKTTESEENSYHNFNEDSSSVQSFSYETDSDRVKSIHNDSYNVENSSGVEYSSGVENNSDVENSSEVENSSGAQSSLEVENINDLAYVKNDNITSTSSECEDDGVHSTDCSTVEFDDSEDETDYTHFSLETNEVFEGTLCSVTGPTSMTLIISKVGGVNIKASKDELQKMMYEKCPNLPILDKIIPGKGL